jgi:hypothetical protein
VKAGLGKVKWFLNQKSGLLDMWAVNDENPHHLEKRKQIQIFKDVTLNCASLKFIVLIINATYSLPELTNV